MSLEATEKLLRSSSDSKRVAGLVVAGRILAVDSTAETAQRILDAIPRGFLRRLMRDQQYRKGGIQVAATLAPRCHLRLDELLALVKEVDAERDGVNEVRVLLLGLMDGSELGLRYVVESGAAHNLWFWRVDAAHAPLEPGDVDVAERIDPSADPDGGRERASFSRSVLSALNLCVAHSDPNHVLPRTLALAERNVREADGVASAKALIGVLTSKPNSEARDGCFGLCYAAIRCGALPTNDTDGWKAIELAMRLADVELRVRLRDVLNRSDPEREMKAEHVEALNKTARTNDHVCGRALQLIEATSEMLLNREGTMLNATARISVLEAAEVAATKALAGAAGGLCEFADALADIDPGVDSPDASRSEVQATLSDFALLVGRVLSCYALLRVPEGEEACASSLQHIAGFLAVEQLDVLLPGIAALSEEHKLRRVFLNAGTHLRLADLAARRAVHSSQSERDGDSAMLAVHAAANLMETGSAIVKPSKRELRAVTEKLRPVLKHDLDDDLREQIEALLTVEMMAPD